MSGVLRPRSGRSVRTGSRRHRVHRWVERKTHLVFGIMPIRPEGANGVHLSRMLVAVLRPRDGFVGEVVVGGRWSFYFLHNPPEEP